MSTYDYGFGITEEDREKLTQIRALQERHAEHSTHKPQYPNKPKLPLIDGERQCAELRGNKTTKVHRPDPDEDSPFPWCAEKAGGYDVGSSPNEWKYRRLSVAREWRDPCRVCFPEGFSDE